MNLLGLGRVGEDVIVKLGVSVAVTGVQRLQLLALPPALLSLLRHIRKQGYNAG